MDLVFTLPTDVVELDVLEPFCFSQQVMTQATQASNYSLSLLIVVSGLAMDTQPDSVSGLQDSAPISTSL